MFTVCVCSDTYVCVCNRMRVIIPLVMGIYSFQSIEEEKTETGTKILLAYRFFFCMYLCAACRVEAFVMHVKNGNDDGKNKVRKPFILDTEGTSNTQQTLSTAFFLT